jgi:type IV pilus assembly protein PilW
LIEILIALVLGLVLVGAAASLYLANHQTFRQVENLARINENARLAFELLGRDLREAGGIACGAGLPTAVVVQSNAWWNAWGNGLQGFEGDAAVPANQMPARAFGIASGDRVDGTDAVVVWSSSLGPSVGVASHHPPAAQLQVSTNLHGLADGDIVMACDLRQAAIFQVTNANPANTTIVHNTGAAVVPGNCRKELGLSSAPPHDCSTAGSDYSFAAGGSLARLQAHAWYVGFNGRGGTSLFQIALGNAAGVAQAGAPVEMIENVSNMQLLYLERNAAGDLGGSYVPAPTVNDWSRVQAVRLELTFQSADRIGAGGAHISRTLPFVVGLRNRLP